MGAPTSSQFGQTCFSWRLRTRGSRRPLDGIGWRVCTLAVCIELCLQRLLVLLAIWPVGRALGTEGYGRAGRTAGFDRNIREPFGNAYRRFLHVTGMGVTYKLADSIRVRKGAPTTGCKFAASYCPVKNSVISGAVPARPGNVSTPDVVSTRRNVLWCWYSVWD